MIELLPKLRRPLVDKEVSIVAIGNPERHVRKVSHRDSKQQ